MYTHLVRAGSCRDKTWWNSGRQNNTFAGQGDGCACCSVYATMPGVVLVLTPRPGGGRLARHRSVEAISATSNSYHECNFLGKGIGKTNYNCWSCECRGQGFRDRDMQHGLGQGAVCSAARIIFVTLWMVAHDEKKKMRCWHLAHPERSRAPGITKENME